VGAASVLALAFSLVFLPLPVLSGEAVATSDPLELLKLDGAAGGAAAGAQSACSPAALSAGYGGSLERSVNARSDRLKALMAKKDDLSAIGEAKTDADAFSYCYAHYGNEGYAPTYAAAVGHFLAVAAVASHNARMDNDEIIDARHRATVLLTYAKGTGQDTSGDLTALGRLQPHAEQTTGTGAYRNSAKDAVGAFESNQLGFDRAYLGKTLQISGPAASLTPNNDGALLKLLGIARDPDQQGLQDYVSCWIKDKGAVDKASTITVPQTVTVAGRYEHVGVGAGIQLTGCIVISVSAAKEAVPR
jgi:hypothetical protein